MELKGTNGIITANEKYVEISRKSFGGVMTQGQKGDKRFYYKDLMTVEYKKPSIISNGYIQLVVSPELASNQGVNISGTTKQDASKDPNAVILRAFKKGFADETQKFYNYVMEQLDNYK